MLPSGTHPVRLANAMGGTDSKAVAAPHDGILAPLGSVGEKTLGIPSVLPRSPPPPQATASIKAEVAVTERMKASTEEAVLVRRISGSQG